jgi:tRNA 2-selenouridine synthase
VDAIRECRLVLLSGLTGTGKTEVIEARPDAIDLEAHANHRGSAFGKRATPQPSPIDFEHRIAIDLLRKRAAGMTRFVMEDEGRSVGSCGLPLPLREAMLQLPVVWLEDAFEARVDRILRDYVTRLCAEFIALQGEEAGFEVFAARLRASLAAMTRRLGAERFRRIDAMIAEAIESQRHTGSVERHRAWIGMLLTEYYDPMYQYQRSRKTDRIVFTGDRDAVLGWLESTG